MAKIVPEAININCLLYLRWALNKDPVAVKLLKHAGSRLNAGAIRLATDPQINNHCSPTLITEVANSRSEDRYAGTAPILRDVINMAAMLGVETVNMLFRSKKAVRRVHDTLAAQTRRQEFTSQFASLKFPEPPLPENINQGVTAIRDINCLRVHADNQNNCSCSYARRIANGELYLYEVRAGEEIATLAVTRSGEEWTINDFNNDLKARNNQAPSAAIIKRVKQWWGASREMPRGD